jgi:hypothetical protein
LDGFSTLLLPVFEISTDVEFQSELTLTFKLDLPACLELASDVCLAILSEDDYLWNCVSRDFEILEDNWVSTQL